MKKNKEIGTEPEFEQLQMNFDDYTISVAKAEEETIGCAPCSQKQELEEVVAVENDPEQISIFDELEAEDDEPHEIKVKKKLKKMRENINSFEELTEFIKLVKEQYNCGYGEAPRAIAQAALATAWYLSKEFGITGFQASCTMWDFITDWEFIDNKCGMKIVDFDDMLYPQYAYKFSHMTISESTWKAVQAEAQRKIDEADSAEKANNRHYVQPCRPVYEHWKSLARGEVPFSCKIDRD